jgi:molybdopterin-guanine dinucleotide biosynthesis protein A
VSRFEGGTVTGGYGEGTPRTTLENSNYGPMRAALDSLALRAAAWYTLRRGEDCFATGGRDKAARRCPSCGDVEAGLVNRIEGMSGVVLAGGRNSRMGGRDKCTLVVRGKPIIMQIVELLDGLFAEVILVTNHPAAYRALVTGIRVVRDRYSGRGPLAGLQAGLEACSREAAFCVACDMPYLDADLIRRQAALFRQLQAERVPAAVLLPRTGSLIEPLHGIYRRDLEPAIRALLEDGEG